MESYDTYFVQLRCEDVYKRQALWTGTNTAADAADATGCYAFRANG